MKPIRVFAYQMAHELTDQELREVAGSSARLQADTISANRNGPGYGFDDPPIDGRRP